ncbi:helix-turn-helix transcriptional regulator [Actinocorallia herbida]|uniref:helix-turn-helix transcriptional regulator n=1 Tax=Actinocorallia herbida TaxID=58109 RepID=UPI0011CDA410|nr:helix-turn-helix transcriptional regulator [Actinocorallia herbida]
MFCGAFEVLYNAPVEVIGKGRDKEYSAVVTGSGGRWKPKSDKPPLVLTAAPVPDDVPLSQEDIAILALLATGKTIDTLSRQLKIRRPSAHARVRAICAQINVRNPIAAVAWAARRNLI